MGMYRTEATFSQHYYWTNLSENVCTYIKFCKTFQKNKKKTLSMSNYPLKKRNPFYETDYW